jgi:hypothetical protein
MKNTTYLFVLLLSANSFGGAYLDFGIGAQHRMLQGDSLSYKSNQSAIVDFNLGYAWKKWDLALDASYSFGRQKDLPLNYTTTQIKDDFNMHGFKVGPTFKYHVTSKSGKWDIVPFAGAFFDYTVFENTAELVDQTTGEREDKAHETWGYGGKVGLEFKKLTPESSWADSVNYKLFASYTKYRDIEGDYVDGSRIVEYKGDTPDNLHDYSVGLTIGFSIGEKLGKKVWNSAKSIANL